MDKMAKKVANFKCSDVISWKLSEYFIVCDVICSEVIYDFNSVFFIKVIVKLPITNHRQ